MAAVDLSVLIPAINFSTTTVAVLSVAAALVGVYVVINASRFVLGMVRGQVYAYGRFWDQDVYNIALKDVKKSMRTGELVDRQSREAIRRFESGSLSDAPKRRRSTRIPRC